MGPDTINGVSGCTHSCEMFSFQFKDALQPSSMQFVEDTIYCTPWIGRASVDVTSGRRVQEH
jgi:hypothetical protein